MENKFDLLKKCKTFDEVNNFIDKHFPNGLNAELHRPKDPDHMFAPNGIYIGFNLDRYLYNNKLAAYCHAFKDHLLGRKGKSYWSDFSPRVEEPTKQTTDYFGQDVYEVWTGR